MPALADVPGVATLIITSSKLDEHGALLIVQRNVALEPTTKPVIPVVDRVGVVIVAVPVTTVHKPVPTVAVLPANVAVVVLHRS